MKEQTMNKPIRIIDILYFQTMVHLNPKASATVLPCNCSFTKKKNSKHLQKKFELEKQKQKTKELSTSSPYEQMKQSCSRTHFKTVFSL